MDSTWARMNPFHRHDSYTNEAVTTYKVLSVLSWIAAVVPAVYYSFEFPGNGKHGRHSIWEQNRIHPSAFSMNSLMAMLYFLAMFTLQLGYVGHFFSRDATKVRDATSVAGHFIMNNLLLMAFVLLLTHSWFVLALIVAIINFINLSGAYFRHNSYDRLIHWPAVAAPLAWSFVSIYWTGAMMVYHPTSLIARIVANVFIWGILVYGLFFIMVYRDYTMGLSLSVLTAAIGVGQFFTKLIAFQWIFAFTIMACLFVASMAVATLSLTGNDPSNTTRDTDAERAPLLED